ncbi:thioredoxin domain-containing protein [Candidatus Micrarchaeota archaeon]|nr:thioredoxin domain-containing protein [Candidatus Micrarchaeota archaeon]
MIKQTIMLFVFLMGTLQATLLVTEYVDLQSYPVEQIQPTIIELQNYYGNRILIEIRHYPIMTPPIGKIDSFWLAEASECARDQGKFNEFMRASLANRERLNTSSPKMFAAWFGLNVNQFENCLNSGEKKQKINDDWAHANARGVQGVPALSINSKTIIGMKTFNDYKQAIDSELLNPTTLTPSPGTSTESFICDDSGTCVPAIPVQRVGNKQVQVTNPSEEVTIKFYGDLQSKFVFDTNEKLKTLKQEYGDLIEIEFINYPVPELYTNAELVAKASICAKEQNKQEEFNEKIFATIGQEQNNNAIENYANDINLNIEQFEECVSSTSTKLQMESDKNQAIINKIYGVPTVVINEIIINGALEYSAYKEAVETALNSGTYNVENYDKENETDTAPNPAYNDNVDSQLALILTELENGNEIIHTRIVFPAEIGLEKMGNILSENGFTIESFNSEAIYANSEANKIKRVSTHQGVKIYLNTNYPLPQTITQKTADKIDLKNKEEQKTEDKPLKITLVQKRKTTFFGFPIEYEIKKTINNSGKIEKTDKPWWAFLFGD